MNYIDVKIVDFGNGGYAAGCEFDGLVFGTFLIENPKNVEKAIRRRLYCQIYNAHQDELCRAYDKLSDKFVYTYSKFGADAPAGLFDLHPAENACLN